MYGGQCFRGDCLPSSGAYPGGVVPYGNVPTYLSGVTVPEWGMPISGTPIGLPGPPHVPLGIPAGLQKHVIRNHTPMNIPEPVQQVQDGRAAAAGIQLSGSADTDAHPRAEYSSAAAVRTDS